MGSAASIHPSSASEVTVYDPTVFPKQGVRLSYYQEFISNFGGREAFEGLSTNDVCEKFIKPTTAPFQSSFCELLQHSQHPAVGPAQVFISHAWKYRFLDVCGALLEHFQGALDTIVWFDLFVVNQHKTSTLPFEWWTTTFQSAIRQFGHTVMVLSPWHDPIPLTRAWCLWELYSAIITDCKFEIAFSQQDELQFVEDIGRDPLGRLKQMMATVNVERSECFKAEDRLQIFHVIESSVGFHHVNSVVFQRLRGWVLDTLEKKLAPTATSPDNSSSNALPDRDIIILSNSLGSIYRSEGQLHKALPHLERVYSMMATLCGADDVNTNNARVSLAGVYQGQGDYQQAAQLYESCLQTFRSTVGEEHPSTIATMQCLASLYQAQGRHHAALPILQHCVTAQIKLQGTKDCYEVIAFMTNLSNAYLLAHDVDTAIPLIQENLEISRRVLGPHHPDTLVCMEVLAKAYREQHNYSTALTLFEDCFVTSKMILGVQHEQTLGVMDSLSQLYELMEQPDAAVAMAEDTLQLRIQQCGEDHPSTLTCMHNLGKQYLNRDAVKALSLLTRCWTARKGVIGEGHPWTLQTLFDIGLAHERQHHHVEAKEIFTNCLALEMQYLGTEHQETKRTTNHLATLPSC